MLLQQLSPTIYIQNNLSKDIGATGLQLKSLFDPRYFLWCENMPPQQSPYLRVM